jgi:hypothetical protein
MDELTHPLCTPLAPRAASSLVPAALIGAAEVEPIMPMVETATNTILEKVFMLRWVIVWWVGIVLWWLWVVGWVCEGNRGQRSVTYTFSLDNANGGGGLIYHMWYVCRTTMTQSLI